MTVGSHVHFLTRVPSPKIIMQALAEIKPHIVIAVPLIIEKVYKNKLKPILDKGGIRFLMNIPGLDQVVMKKIRTELIEAFGGKFEEVIIGGAAFNKEVEAFFKRINFPFTVGYGMTECAPLVAYAPWDQQRAGSCGKAVDRMTVRIDSPDPEHQAGVLWVKGDNVMQGYYKNQEATDAIMKDGWMNTGDLCNIDADRIHLYTRT